MEHILSTLVLNGTREFRRRFRSVVLRPQRYQHATATHHSRRTIKPSIIRGESGEVQTTIGEESGTRDHEKLHSIKPARRT
jgi:hypothetical protein